MVQMPLRLEPDLRRKLGAWAKARHWTIAQAMRWILRRTLEGEVRG